MESRAADAIEELRAELAVSEKMRVAWKESSAQENERAKKADAEIARLRRRVIGDLHGIRECYVQGNKDMAIQIIDSLLGSPKTLPRDLSNRLLGYLSYRDPKA